MPDTRVPPPAPPPPPPPVPVPETRYPCPVCLGVKLSKVPIVSTQTLMLDRCQRCGGIWFDEGETARLRSFPLEGVRQKVRPAESVFKMSCHGCQALMERDADQCPVCSWNNVLECPVCAREMKRRRVEGLQLDFCTHCRGVWFDQIELAEIWNLRATPGERRSTDPGAIAGGIVEGGGDVAEILFWNADLVVWGAEAAFHGTRAVASGASHVVTAAPSALGGAVEATGDLAGTVFEAIAEIVGGIFS